MERQPEGESTQLGTTLRAVLDDLRGMPPAAVVLLTDGVNTQGPSLDDAAEWAVRKGVPLFPIGLGDQKPIRDVQLTDLLVEDIVFVGRYGTVRVPNRGNRLRRAGCGRRPAAT